MTPPDTRALHVFYDDDSEEFWVAYDMADLRAVIDEEHGPGTFSETYSYGDGSDSWCEQPDDATKVIMFTDEPAPGLKAMATEDDNPNDCQEATKTMAEWAALNGRGYFGGGRS